MHAKSFAKVQSFQYRPAASHQATSTPNGSGNINNSLPPLRLSPSEYDAAAKHMKDRFIYVLANALGSKITVTTNDNEKITGILQSISTITDSIPSLILKFPTRENHVYENEFLTIPQSLISMFTCENVDISPKTSSLSATSTLSTSNSPKPTSQTLSATGNDKGEKKGTKGLKDDKVAKESKDLNEFKTDSQIANSSFKEKPLEKWIPDDSAIVSEALEDIKPGNWDQFKANKAITGLEPEYDEEEYTTRLNTNSKDFAKRLEFAKKMEKEILSAPSNGNLHIDEERGRIVDVSNVDEEDKYSGVLRENAQSEEKLMNMLKSPSGAQKNPPQLRNYNEGQYIPPSQRAAQQHKDPAVVSTSTPTSAANTTTTKSAAKKIPDTAAKQLSSPIASSSASLPPPISTKLPEKPIVKESAKKVSTPSFVSPPPSSSSKKTSTSVDAKRNLAVSPPVDSKQNLSTPVHNPLHSSGSASTPPTVKTEPNDNMVSSQLQQSQPKQPHQNHASNYNHNQQQHMQSPSQHPQQLPPQHQQQPQQQHMPHAMQQPMQQYTHAQPHLSPYQPQNNQMRNTQRHNYQPNDAHPNGPLSNNYRFNNQHENGSNNNNNGHSHHNRVGPSKPLFRLHGSYEKPKTGRILEGKFNILATTKKEYLEKNPGSDVLIIPMAPSYATQPGWPETIETKYDVLFKAENKPPQIQMQSQMYVHPGYHPYAQGYSPGYSPQYVQQPYYYYPGYPQKQYPYAAPMGYPVMEGQPPYVYQHNPMQGHR